MKVQKLIGRVVLYAPNLHTGGGIVILKSIIKNWPVDIPVVGYFDSRADEILGLCNDSKISWVNPTIYSRLKAEISLSKTVSDDDVVLFLNSLPPLFNCKGRNIVFLQNRNLIEQISLRGFKFKQALRITIERILFYLFKFRVDEYIVQTDSFKRVLDEWGKPKDGIKSEKITVFPFMDLDELLDVLAIESPPIQYDFIYVADSLSHKNHLALLDAWEILADLGHHPSLAITLPSSEVNLLKKVSRLQKKGLKIVNLGWLPQSEVLLKYKSCRALIFPSLRESFGLPLLEASKLNIPILASELDYVYDVCEPEQTFDPASPHSIARAVTRFLNIKPFKRKVQDPKDFVRYIFYSTIDGGNDDRD